MALIFAAAPFFISDAMGSISPMSLVFLRFIIALLFQTPFFIRRGIRQMLPEREDFAWVLSLGVFGMFAFHYLYIAAIGRTSPLNIAVITAAVPIIASLIAAFKGLERLSRGRVCAMLLSFVGVLIVLSRGDVGVIAGMDFNIGDVMMLVGVFCMAWCNVSSKRLLLKYSPMRVTSFFMLMPALFSFPTFIYESGSIAWGVPAVWTAALFSGFFASFLAVYFQQHAIKQIGVSRTVAFNNLIPVFSAVISFALLGAQSVTPVQIMSMCMIIGGVLWNSRIS